MPNPTGLQQLHSTLFQDALKQGLQSFVKTSNTLSATSLLPITAGSTFYSTVVGRASIPDITADLRASFGIERIQVQQIIQIQNEFGPNGEPVLSALNDDRGLIRFVGQWTTVIGTSGISVSASANTTDFVEVTFYGTALNVLSALNQAFPFNYSVDGGVAVSTTTPASASSVLSARNYQPNQIFSIVSGLSLGIHTVKIQNNSVSTAINFAGFEVVNASSSISINPGVAYIDGLKTSPTAAQSFLYNAPVTGTRGGRVVAYLKTDGTAGQAWQAVNSATATLTSADHTNEEMVRQYSPREFGAGRSDDFSALARYSSAGSAAFTLDDGTTSLVASSGFYSSATGEFRLNTTGDFITISFVGTGLDIILKDNAAAVDAHSVTIDGSSAGSLTGCGTANISYQRKIISGLPYGTHTIKITRSASALDALTFKSFTVYQPKKPSIPAGAIELCDYNVMATYVQGTTGLNTVATGVLRKSTTREMTYVEGTSADTAWSIAVDSTVIGGNYLFSNRSGSNMFSGTFFGTGAELRASSYTNGDTTISVFIDGVAATSANFPSATFSFYGTNGGSFTASTGILSLRGSGNYNDNNSFAGFSVSGLSLGKHTITLSKGTTGSFAALFVYALDIITPVHSVKSNTVADLQNTLPVGSQALSDNRKTSAIKEILPSKKAWAQAVGVSASPSTTATSFVPVPDLSVTLNCTGGRVFIIYNVSYYVSTVAQYAPTAIYVDGVAVSTFRFTQLYAASTVTTQGDYIMVNLSPGAHKIDVYWYVNNGTATLYDVKRNLTAFEI